MDKTRYVIRGGEVYLSEEKKLRLLSVAVAGGKIFEIGECSFSEGWKEIDASGCIVSPGFIDSHMHDEQIPDPHTIQKALLRQGVTTAIAGNCGAGPLYEDIAPHRKTPWLNLGYLTGHTVLREKVGVEDRYRAATEEEIESMVELLWEELQKGSLGLSFGLEYMPQTSSREISRLASVVEEFPKRWIAVHIRYDGPQCLEGVREVVDMARNHALRVQISHFGSMNAFGNCQASLDLIEEAWKDGVDITLDCYPYAAFCTRIGSAVFDPGFEERWGGKGLESIEAGSGKYKGQRLTPESYRDLRENYPKDLGIAHVLNEAEVRACLKHPRCAVASDGVLFEGQGHPRAAGTFPRALRQHLRILRNAPEKGTHHPQHRPGGLLPGLPSRAARIVARELAKRQIALREQPLRGFQGGRLLYEGGSSEEADFLMVATGVRPPKLLQESGLSTDQAGALMVGRYLQSPDNPEIFGGGRLYRLSAPSSPACGGLRPSSGAGTLRQPSGPSHR